jgi:hypothetical protein
MARAFKVTKIQPLFQGFQGDKNSAFILKGLEILARVFPQTKANHINMLGAPP